jgi:hypothetical protein
MKSLLTRAIAGAGILAMVLTAQAGPAHAEIESKGATPAVVIPRPRAAVMAGTQQIAPYDDEPGATVAYTGQAVESTRAVGQSTFTASCEGVLPLYWYYPYALEILPICWLQDTTTGAKHYLTDTTGWYMPVTSAHGQFILPTNHSYKLCVQFSSMSTGWTTPDCDALA